jgi:hypothetical protein
MGAVILPDPEKADVWDCSLFAKADNDLCQTGVVASGRDRLTVMTPE